MSRDPRTPPSTYPSPPVELPLDDWLYEGEPVPGCDVCKALAEERTQARKQSRTAKACEAAREIRNHPHQGTK